MRKLGIAIVLGSVLMAAPFSAAMSQSTKSDYTVFIDRSGNKPLTAAAKDTIHKAVTASRSHVIEVSGVPTTPKPCGTSCCARASPPIASPCAPSPSSRC